VRALVAQLTDTHIVTRGSTYFGVDTARYLSDAIDELHALPVLPDCVVVTGDLVNTGKHAEYDRFFGVMQRLRVPYFVVPGNHDDGVALRAALPSRSFGASREPRLRYAIEEFAIRIVGLDVNKPGSSPGAALDDESLSWLERILEGKRKPTILCVHQPPFRSGLHYLDIFGFRGARGLRRLLDRHPEVGRVLCGHIHCVQKRAWRYALACSAPSTAPQIVPLIFMDRRLFGMRRERPGFALHEWSATLGFTTTIVRRDEGGRYRAITA